MPDRAPIRIIDVTLRDAHQCLWATRMTTAMMRELAPRLDRTGFDAIDLVGGAVFDVCVRYLREDPWERMRLVASNADSGLLRTFTALSRSARTLLARLSGAGSHRESRS